MKQLSLIFNDAGIEPQAKKKMDTKEIKRLYYSIAEVSRITGLKPYVLRFWETEFKELRPAKNRAGNRIYRKSDIKLIFLIKRLLYHEKYTIDGARQKLRHLKKGGDPQLTLNLYETKIDEVLREIRIELEEILDLMDGRRK